MKKAMACLLLWTAVLVMIVGCGGRAEEKAEVFVAAAASLTDVMREIGDLYQKANPGEKITYHFGGSGSLQVQIQQGAPVDVFISAAQKPMDTLAQKDLIVKESREDLLFNQVVLIAKKDAVNPIHAFTDVAKAKRIALGEPKGVPVGLYAEQIFTKLHLLDEVKAKAVYGSDVRQVLTWVENSEAEIGVVYATDAARSDKVAVLCEAPDGSHMPVVYPAAVMKESKNSAAANRFMLFLRSKEAAAVFGKYGFRVK